MILQALTDYYDSLIRDGLVGKPGWSKLPISYQVVLNEDGKLIQLQSILAETSDGKSLKKFLLVPEPEHRSGTQKKAHFLCDNAGYLLGYEKGSVQLEKFNAAKELHHKILDHCQSTVAKAILKFFDCWNPLEAEQNSLINAEPDAINNGGNLIFIVNQDSPLIDKEICRAWDSFKANSIGDFTRGQCLVTGRKNVPIARIHPNIKGVRGAQTSGAAIVSFNTNALESYGHDGEQGNNAPVGEYAAFAYSAALNYLIRERKCSLVGGDTVVYWSADANPLYQDGFSECMGNDAGISEADLAAMIEKISKGQQADISGVTLSPDEPFYVLGLAPNAARLSIRFFYRNTFGATIAHIAEHHQHMKIVRPSWEKQEQIPLWRLLKATVNPHSKDPASSPLLAGSLLRSILQGQPYPEAMYQNILLRVFSDQDERGDNGTTTVNKITYVKAAFIKAYLLKNHFERWGEDLTMAVNEDCKALPYVLGRLFSVLEALQEAANPGINATIKDRYFNAACATPGSVFPTLMKLANAHLAKLEKRQQVYYSKKLQALADEIVMPNQGKPIPSRLNQEEQGVFILGYYQETQKRFTKKEEK